MAAMAEKRSPEKQSQAPWSGKGPARLSCQKHGKKALHEQGQSPLVLQSPMALTSHRKITCKIEGRALCCFIRGKGCSNR